MNGRADPIEIARALMGEPRVLFLDEPTRGLDLPAKRETWNFLRELASREDVTTFLSSHDAQEIRNRARAFSGKGDVGGLALALPLTPPRRTRIV